MSSRKKSSPKITKAMTAGFRSDYARQAKKICELGGTLDDLADAFGVEPRTISSWQTHHTEFAEACRIGEERADDRVEQSMYRCAVGYEVIKSKVIKVGAEPVIVEYREEVPPDVNAAILWLTARHRNWKVHRRIRPPKTIL